MPAQQPQPHSPAQPEQPEPVRRRPPARRTGARLYSPGSDTTARRIVERRAQRDRQRSAAARSIDDDVDPDVNDLPDATEHTGTTKRSSTATSTSTAKTARTAKSAGTTTRAGTTRRAADETADEDEARRTRPLLLPVILAVVTVVLGGLAAWFGTEAHALTSTPAASNGALTNATQTSAVRTQITSAIDTLFSYDYANPGPTTRAASRLLTGPAVRQYADLFAQVRKDAPSQKLIVTTAVTNLGVEQLTGDQARLLVFATETDQRVGGGQPASAAAMLAVNAIRQGSTWKIETIDTY